MNRKTMALALGAFVVWSMADSGLPSPVYGKTPSRPPADSMRDRVTFTRDVAPIIFEQCASCHRPGGAAPFALVTYDDVARRARTIEAAVRSRVMPPWKPDPGYAEFAGERRLTDAQIALIQRWIEQGAVEGEPTGIPQPSPIRHDWQLGEEYAG